MTTFKSEFLSVMQERGFLHQCSNFEALDAKLAAGPVSAYCGFDPSGKSLHIGHLVPIMMMHWFQKTGNKPYTLVGGGTGMIGDPSFKDKTRPMLTVEDIKNNAEAIRQNYAKFIRYGSAANDAVMVNNADWLMKLNYMEFLRDYGTYYTINRMLSFDSVKLRLDREQPLTFLEFNYMIMQGYDFLHLHRTYGIDLQLGGSDQWGNMISGVDLAHKAIGKELFVLTVPLLTTASGAKMGKTEGGAVWLNPQMTSPYDMWQYWRNTEDADVVKFLKLFTTLPMDEIARLEKLAATEINEVKKILAFEATKLCHSEEESLAAAETARKTFEQGGVGGNLPSIEIDQEEFNSGLLLIEVLKNVGFAKSNGEAKRLISQNAIKINDQTINDEFLNITNEIKCNLNDEYIKYYTSILKSISDEDSNQKYKICLKLSSGKKKHALVKIKA